jgi:hypothetical protein
MATFFMFLFCSYRFLICFQLSSAAKKMNFPLMTEQVTFPAMPISRIADAQNHRWSLCIR